MPLQEGTPVVVLHALAHAPQVDVDDSEVSQPSVFGGPVVMQSAHPGWHPECVHPAPLQAAPLLWVVSQMLPHAPQLVTDDRLLEQPPTLGGVVLQSMTVSCGQPWSVGAVVSWTVTTCARLDVLPQRSLALHVRVSV